MADPNIDSLNATTYKEVYPRHIRDNLFKNAPFMKYLRANSFTEFLGGLSMDETFMYGAMNGGAYTIGAPFNISVVENLAALTFNLKFYEAAVAEYMELIRAINTGPLAFFSRINAKIKGSINTLNTIIAIDLWKHGQASASTVAANRLAKFNGLSEVINDGVLYSYQGDIFANYGGQARNGIIGPAINGNVIWGGNSDGSTADITYDFMNILYETASVGDQEPDVMVVTKRTNASILNRIQPQQRFAQEMNPVIGSKTYQFRNCSICKDDYAPSQVQSAGGFGVNDAKLGDYTTAAFTNSLTGTPNNNFPNSTAAATLTPGEPIWFLRTEMFHFRLSADPLYQFGFTGFIPNQGNSKVVGHTFAAGNLYCESPRHNSLGLGTK